MGTLNIELCPETGICSIHKADGTKADLMPGEVAELRGASGELSAVKGVIAEADEKFAEALTADEIAQLISELSK